MSKNPEVLSKETETKIKQTHLNKIKEDYPFAKLSGIHIIAYYGTYGDCVAVTVKDDYRAVDVLEIPEMEVGGVKFFNMSNPGLMIWKENS